MSTARVDIHDQVSELVEEHSVQRLGEEVCDHVLGRAVFNLDVTRCHSILDEEVSDIEQEAGESA